MTLGLLVKPEVLATTGIIESTNYFDNSDRAFTKNQEIRVDDSIYYRYADSLIVPNFDANKTDYKLNDVVYKDGKVNYINGVSGTAAKQPESYSNIDTSLESNTWTSRYLKIGTFANNMIKKSLINGDTDYKYYFTNNAGIVKYEEYLLEYQNVEGYINTNNYKYVTCIITKGIGETAYYYRLKNDVIVEIEFLTDDFQVNIEYIISDGVKIKGRTKQYSYAKEEWSVNDWNRLSANDKLDVTLISHYSFEIKQSSTVKYIDIKATYQSSLEATEEKAIVTDNYRFEPKSFVIRGNDLYMRTNKDVAQETIEITEISTKTLEALSEIEWGWDLRRPIKSLLPFDNKKYTAIEEHNEISFTLKSNEEFDEIALNDVFASSIKIEILDSTDAVLETINRIPKTLITNGVKQTHFPTISITYLDSFVTTNQKVRITLTPLNGKVSLGEGCLGDAWNWGKTKMLFKSSAIDYTAPTTDEFGVKTESGDMKVRVLDADVVLNTKYFSDGSKMLLKTSGHRMIYDGNDNYNNEDIDNRRYFEPVMIIGQAKITEQTTRIDRDDISDYSDYHIYIEESL